MTTNYDNLEPNETATRGSKRPYLKPAFQYEQAFETMALACGKVAGTMPQCDGFNANAS